MTEVKKPVLLDANLNDETMLHPASGTLKLQMTGTSEATLTLEDKAESIGMHRWVKIWSRNGLVGYFRRSSRGRNIGNDNTYTLKHGIDILQDSVWDAETTFTGTMTQFLTALLDKQTHLIKGVKPWVLGGCADTSSVSKNINYDNLLDLLEGAVDEGGGYYFSYNQSVWPWQLFLVAKSSSVASEFRLDRNMEKCQIKDNDSEMCTRLILSVNKMVKDNTLSGYTADGSDVNQNSTVIRTYNNTTAQASYGVIVKTADIDVENDTFPNGPFPEADAWAADFLAQRAEPMLQVEIDGTVLSGLTGDTWDESSVGTMVRVALPDYATAIAERCVTVTYPNLYAEPERITVSLANALPKFTKTMQSTQKTVAKNSRSSRKSNREAESFEQHFKITDKAGNVLQQAGLKMDANGLLVYADDNVNMVGSKFNVQADKIGMVVGTNSGGNFIKAAEIAVAINTTTGEGTAYVNADHVNISATQTAYSLAGEMERDANGKLIIKSAGGMYVRKTISGVTAEFGVYDNNNLTAGVIATIVNGESSTLIKGTKIQIGTSDTVGTWISNKTYLNDVTADYIKTKIATVSALNTQNIYSSGTVFVTYDLTGTGNSEINIMNTNKSAYFTDILVGASVSLDGTELTLTNLNGDTVTFEKGSGGGDYDEGYDEGWDDGYASGYYDGYIDGEAEGGGGGYTSDDILIGNVQHYASEPSGTSLSTLSQEIAAAYATSRGRWITFDAYLDGESDVKRYKINCTF